MINDGWDISLSHTRMPDEPKVPQDLSALDLETQREAMGYAEERAKLFAACRDYRAQLDAAQQDIARLQDENARLRADKERMDFILGYEDECPGSFFVWRNRDNIDSCRAALAKEATP